MNQELFGVYDDQDIKTIHLVKAYAALAVIGILGWAYIKWDSERVHPNKFIVHFFYFFWINLFKIFSSFVSIKRMKQKFQMKYINIFMENLIINLKMINMDSMVISKDKQFFQFPFSAK